MTRAQCEAIAELAAALCGKDSHVVAPHRARAIAMRMHAIGLRAHRLFERNCDDLTLAEQAYFRRRARLTKAMTEACLGTLREAVSADSARLSRMGVWEWQTDPRGWPVIVRVTVAGNTIELRVGGR